MIRVRGHKGKELVVTFWTHATQLQSHPAWAAFIKQVRELASDPQWFQYEELAAVIDYKDGTNAS